MKKLVFIPVTIFYAVLLQAQHKVTFILKEQSVFKHDSIYITGTFNNWDSTANKNYLLRPYGENDKAITLNLKAGIIKYKFHRGGWATVEKTINGNEVPGRSIFIHKDTALTDIVSGWRNQRLIDRWYTLATENEDTNRIKTLASIAHVYANYENYNSDSALYYAQRALQLQQKIMISAGSRQKAQPVYMAQMVSLRNIIANVLHSLGDYPKSLELRFENLKIAETQNNKLGLVFANSGITYEYISMEDYKHVLSYAKLEDSILGKFNPTDKKDSLSKLFAEWYVKNQLVTAYYNLQMPDSALVYAEKLKTFFNIMSRGPELSPYYLSATYKLLGDIYVARGDTKTALSYYRPIVNKYGGAVNAGINEGMAKLFQKEDRTDSALIYAKRALTFYQTHQKEIEARGEESSNYYIAEISPLVAHLYKANVQLDSAYKYLQLSVTLKDSLYTSDKIRQFQTLAFNEDARRQQEEQQRIEAQQHYEANLKIYGLITVIAGILIFSFIIYRNDRNRKKANELLQRQKQEIEAQKKNVEGALAELKSTQSQLIQSEKMASLGELTAGIAHEIQNPLNFVNNFSEVSNEMVDEMNNELDNGDIEEAKAIANDIKQNLEKIKHHGKRADSIVKGMLQHTRANSGQKELTDINKLADEYLKFAFNAVRIKDKSFNTTLTTNYDESASKINIVSQDISRVFLNIYNNAFYAVNEKAKQQVVNYAPAITVTTKKVNDKIEISIRDNGNGIPQKVVDKIFQPFFTTKPTGQGTGLGLSLSYDIIKAHGGEIRVNTGEGEFTEFVINIPF